MEGTETETTVDEIQEKFDTQERRFAELEQHVSNLREFFAKYRDAIAPFSWSCYGFDAISFYAGTEHYKTENKPKAIARAFGADGWTREFNSSTCGAVNWLKTIDGVVLISS